MVTVHRARRGTDWRGEPERNVRVRQDLVRRVPRLARAVMGEVCFGFKDRVRAV